MQLNFCVKNQMIIRSDGEKPVANSKNYLKAKFIFQSDEWDGLVKTVIFKQRCKVRHVLLDETGECFVPYELLDTGVLYVSVFAGDLITTNSCLVKILKSGYEEGTKPEDPTTDIYDQIMKRIEEIADGNADTEQIEKIVNEYLKENPIETLTEEEVKQITKDYVEEHKAELKGDKGDKGDTGEKGADGMDGADGVDGASAYSIAVANGFIGTEVEWLESLRGTDGKDGKDGKDGAPGQGGADGRDGEDGKSAYEIAVNNGFTGTEAEWLASLKGSDGEKGEPGPAGSDGKDGSNGLDGKNGVSPIITENDNNTDNDYKLDIITENSKFTTPNLKGGGFWITPQMFGAVADGVTDDSDAIQLAIDNAPNGATLYFPKGVYAISKGLVTSGKDISIRGERNGRYIGKNDALSANWGSIIKYIGDSDATLITQGPSDWNLTITDIILHSNSCTFTDNGLDDETIPYAQYSLTKKDIVVNGIKTIHTSSMRRVALVGMSGYGLSPTQAMNVVDCNFYACNRCIQVENNDLMLRNCYLTASGTAIYCVGSRNIIVSDCYMDLLSEYGIYCENYLSGSITDVYIDHSNYAAICAKGAFNNLNLDIFCGRNGMYYAGSTLDDIKDTTAATELENMSLGATVCVNFVFRSQLKIHAIKRPVDDAGTSVKSAPALGLYIQQLRSGIIEGVQLESYIRNTSNTTEPASINANGVISSVYKNREYKKVGLFKASYAPQSTHMASQIGDMWLYSNNIYMATEKTDDATTWTEFGKDGYTPKKGTDYWTDEDMAEIKNYIDQQIGGALDGSY